MLLDNSNDDSNHDNRNLSQSFINQPTPLHLSMTPKQSRILNNFQKKSNNLQQSVKQQSKITSHHLTSLKLSTNSALGAQDNRK